MLAPLGLHVRYHNIFLFLTPQAWHISFVQTELSRLRGGWSEASKLRCEIDKISRIDRYLLQIYNIYDIIFPVQILKNI